MTHSSLVAKRSDITNEVIPIPTRMANTTAKAGLYKLGGRAHIDCAPGRERKLYHITALKVRFRQLRFSPRICPGMIKRPCPRRKGNQAISLDFATDDPKGIFLAPKRWKLLNSLRSGRPRILRKALLGNVAFGGGKHLVARRPHRALSSRA